MDWKKLLPMAVVGGLAVALVPEILPTGPTAALDASALLQSGQWVVGAGVIFLAGLLTSFTPCVYPLIPITVGVFGARRAESRTKAFLLTSAYVVGMGVVFSTLGVVAAKTGQAFGTLLGNPWVVSGLAVFLLVLASSMFGAFELTLPAGLTQKLSGVGGAGFLGAFLMGSVSGFLTAPCTGPVLTGVLAFVAKSQSTLLGASLLFIYALGIGVPFFLIGAFTVRMPRGGVWMDWVKSVFGIALVALAVLYLRDAFAPVRESLAGVARELGRSPGAWLAALLTACGLLLGAVHLSFKESLNQRLLKASGVLLVVVALTVRAGAATAPPAGELWVRRGWQQRPSAPEFTWNVKFTGSSHLDVFEAALVQARSSGKPVMIDFFADWCGACKDLDKHTYVASEVISEASRFLNIKVDATNEEEAIEALFQRFGVRGLPTVAFVSSDGTLLDKPKVTGFLGPAEFVSELKKVQ